MVPQTNLSTTLIANTLGISSHTVSELCSSEKINKWAKYKPVIYRTDGPITEELRFEAYYGIDRTYITSGSSLGAYFEKAKGDWEYAKPTGRSASPYRLGDFRGYNHWAISPFSYSIPTLLETYSGKDIPISCFMRNLYTSDFRKAECIECLFPAWYDSYKWAIAWRKSGTTENYDVHIVIGPYVKDDTDTVSIEGVLPETGTYEIMLCATTATTEEWEGESVIWLPLSYRTVTVTKMSYTASVSIDNADSLRPYLTQDGKIVNFNYMLLAVRPYYTNLSGGWGIGRLDFWINVSDENGYYISAFEFNADYTGEFSYTGGDEETFTLDYMAGTGIDLTQYIDSSEVSRIYNVELRAIFTTVSGITLFALAKSYIWNITGDW